MESKVQARKIADAVLIALTAAVILWALVVAARNSHGGEIGVAGTTPTTEEGEKLLIDTANSHGAVIDNGNIEWNVYIPFRDVDGGPQLEGYSEVVVKDSLRSADSAPHSFDPKAEHSVILYGFDYEGKRFDYAADPDYGFTAAQKPTYQWGKDGKTLTVKVKEPRGGWKKWCEKVNEGNKDADTDACQLRLNYQTAPDGPREPKDSDSFTHKVTAGVTEIPSNTVTYEESES